MNVLHSLTPIQKQYYFDESRFLITSAGRRSRKTLISSSKLLRRALKGSLIESGRQYFQAAPTNAQAKSIFWDKLKKNTKPLWTKDPRETELIVYLPNDTKIRVLGLDKPERIEGQPWHGGHITEFPNAKPEAWENNIFPVFMDTDGFCIIDGVPEGYGKYYDMALYAAGGAIPRTIPNKGAYGKNKEWAFYTWFSSDVLSPEAIKIARTNLDEKTYRQEFEGSFESFEGLAYYNFSKRNIRRNKYKKGEHIYIGMDFNVNPMTAVIGHIKGKIFYQFDEVYLKNSNTFEMKRHLIEKYPYHEMTINPDSTGKAMESNAKQSDLAILRDNPNPIDVKARSVNPYVKDRLSAMNSQMLTINGDIRYYVDPSCIHTINDFNRVERLDDGRENKKQEEQGLVHISSAAGYCIAYNFPFSRGGVVAL